MQTKLKIVVPTFNTEKWIARCLHSIAVQNYVNFECVVINDASTDKTGEVIDSLDFIKNDERFTVIHNKENVKALKNIVDGFNVLKASQDPEAVLMVVDGDDFLFSPVVFQLVDQIYNQYPAWLTWGNHVHFPTGGQSNCEPITPEIVEQGSYRDYKFVTSHLRTFKSKLWYNIKDADLRDEDGKYFSVGWDVAFMMPMLEMARERAFFVPNVMYCYNRFNPISDDQIRQDEQHRVEMLVRSRERYQKYED